MNIYVPWNEVIVLDPVKLSRTSDSGFVVPDILAPRVPCKDHDFNTMKPLVLATWKHGSQGQMPGKSSILVESQSVLGKVYLILATLFNLNSLKTISFTLAITSDRCEGCSYTYRF